MAETARSVLAEVRRRPTTLGSGRLLCLDGPSGAGKTTLATAVSRLERESRVVHMDALYDGWDGLATVGTQLGTLLGPLAHDEPGRYRRYDWAAGAYAGTLRVPPRPLLVLEGVGAWSPAYADLVTLLVWVEAPADVRLARAVARDGADAEPHLRRWAASERAHLDRLGTRQHADLVVTADGQAPLG